MNDKHLISLGDELNLNCKITRGEEVEEAKRIKTHLSRWKNQQIRLTHSKLV